MLSQLAPDPDVGSGPAARPDPPAGSDWIRRPAGNRTPVWFRPVRPGEDAATTWSDLRARHDSTGWWPVLVTGDFWEAVGEDVDVADPSDALSGQAWLADQLFAGDHPGVAEVPHGPQPELAYPTPDELAAPADPVDEVTHVLLVPARAGWVVPQILGWDGSVNQDVMGAEHTRVLRRWAGRYGAELVGLGRDTVQLRVTRPPRGEPEAQSAALEAYAYCQDAVHQGVGTLEALTPMVVGRDWYFWWD